MLRGLHTSKGRLQLNKPYFFLSCVVAGALRTVGKIAMAAERAALREQINQMLARESAVIREIPECLLDALIVAEDRRFQHHLGVDPFAVLSALFENIFLGKRRGASTVQQQLVRVLTGRYEVTFRRKFREIVLATAVHEYLTQEEILKLYLAMAYYGYRASGLRALLCRLQWELGMLTLPQCASIVARLKYPAPQPGVASAHSTARELRLRNREQFIWRLLLHRGGKQELHASVQFDRSW